MKFKIKYRRKYSFLSRNPNTCFPTFHSQQPYSIQTSQRVATVYSLNHLCKVTKELFSKGHHKIILWLVSRNKSIQIVKSQMAKALSKSVPRLSLKKGSQESLDLVVSKPTLVSGRTLSSKTCTRPEKRQKA